MVDKRKKKRMLKKMKQAGSNPEPAPSSSSSSPVDNPQGGMVGATTNTGSKSDPGSGDALSRKMISKKGHSVTTSTQTTPSFLEEDKLFGECVRDDGKAARGSSGSLKTLEDKGKERVEEEEKTAASNDDDGGDVTAATPVASCSSATTNVEEMLIDFSEWDTPSQEVIVIDRDMEDSHDIICTSLDDNVNKALPIPIPPVKDERMGENERLIQEHFSSVGDKAGIYRASGACTTVVYSHGGAPISSPIVTPTVNWVKNFEALGKVESVFGTLGESGNGDLLDYCLMDVEEAGKEEVEIPAEVKAVETSAVVQPEQYVIEMAPTRVNTDPAPSFLIPLPMGTTNTNDVASQMRATLDKILSDRAASSVEVSPKFIEAPTSCVVKNCKKKPTLKCASCEVSMYCSRKHQRVFAKEHEARCNGFRVIDSYKYGKHTIAARDFKMVGEYVMFDDPLIMLPLNPGLMESGAFPEDYCVQCFTVHGLSDQSEIRRLGWVTGTRACPKRCGLRICKDRRVCELALSSLPDLHRAPTHFENECKYLREAMKRVFHSSTNLPITVDHSFIGLLRFMRQYGVMGRSGVLGMNGPILKMFEGVRETGPTSHYLQSKVMVLRETFMVDEQVIGDDDLRRLELVMEKFGRNCGVDVVTYAKDFGGGGAWGRKSVKCVYPIAGFITHSCLPNSIIVVMEQNYRVAVQTLQELKKGEPLTVCYDNRILFWPVWKRREYLSNEFGFVCKCKRCSSESEMGSYFSGFRCPKKGCSGVNSYIVQTTDYGPWACVFCKAVHVQHEDGYTQITMLQNEIGYNVTKDDPVFFLAYLNNLLGMGRIALHWGNWLVFDCIVKLFAMVWRRMKGGDKDLVQWFSSNKGAQLVGVADLLISFSLLFLPHEYLDSHVVPLRLAGIIKLRDLVNQYKASQTDISSIDQTVKTIYFRAVPWGGRPLYERPCPDGSNPSMEVAEMKILMEMKAAGLMSAAGLPYLTRIYGDNVKKDPDLATDVQGNGGGEGCNRDAFPWNLSV